MMRMRCRSVWVQNLILEPLGTSAIDPWQQSSMQSPRQKWKCLPETAGPSNEWCLRQSSRTQLSWHSSAMTFSNIFLFFFFHKIENEWMNEWRVGIYLLPVHAQCGSHGGSGPTQPPTQYPLLQENLLWGAGLTNAPAATPSDSLSHFTWMAPSKWPGRAGVLALGLTIPTSQEANLVDSLCLGTPC